VSPSSFTTGTKGALAVLLIIASQEKSSLNHLCSLMS